MAVRDQIIAEQRDMVGAAVNGVCASTAAAPAMVLGAWRSTSGSLGLSDCSKRSLPLAQVGALWRVLEAAGLDQEAILDIARRSARRCAA
jgi:hypothetical protein